MGRARYFAAMDRRFANKAENLKKRREQYAAVIKEPSKSHIGGSYSQYLQSDQWRETRRLILGRAAGRCESCNLKTDFLQVHHVSYHRIGKESPTHLMALCGKCHESRHRDKAENSRI
jgi:5-methylcytosine-specific restriction endonuclease McrA